MLKNYLKVALRNLLRQRLYSVLNITGLAVGLAAFIFIALYVYDELQFDRYPRAADNIYRIAVGVTTSSGQQNLAQTPPGWGSRLLAEYPEIENMMRLKPPNQQWVVGYEDLRFYEKGWAFADSTIFEMFSLPLLRGDARSALNAPFTVVISEEMAVRYFGEEDPIGKTILLDNQYEYAITGIMADMPRRSHFRMDFFASLISLQDPPVYINDFLDNLFVPMVYTYVQLHETTDAAHMKSLLMDYVARHVTSQPQVPDGFRVDVVLQPLTDIHLTSNLEREIAPNSNVATLYILAAIGIFILLIACINFMNLATARSASRAREVGLRKVVGARREQLIGQFFGESLLMALLAFFLAVIMVNLFSPAFNDMILREIDISFSGNLLFWVLMAVIALLAGLLAGSYPAFFLSAYQPVAVLKGGTMTGGHRGSVFLRKTLIIFQFMISIALMISTAIVYQQMSYMQQKKLGIARDQVIVIQLTDPAPRTQYPAFREAVRRLPEVNAISASLSGPANFVGTVNVRPRTAALDENWVLQSYFSDHDFLETLGIRLLAGRDFSRDFLTDTLAQNGQGAVILNETAAQAFGWVDAPSALGKVLQFSGGQPNNTSELRVIGVVHDFHNRSLHRKIEPTILFLSTNPQNYFYTFVRVQPANFQHTIAQLEDHWSNIIPGYGFDYSFLDADFQRLYQSEMTLGRIFSTFSVLTIVIACLGLFGLASYTAEQRTREIGVRKVLGASVANIVFHLCREFTLLVGGAFAVASLLAFFAMRRWLSEFAYHTDMRATTFIVAGVVAIAIALLTIIYQAMRAAFANPVDALRSE